MALIHFSGRPVKDAGSAGIGEDALRPFAELWTRCHLWLHRFSRCIPRGFGAGKSTLRAVAGAYRSAAYAGCLPALRSPWVGEQT
jgi:hypothetical protein